MANISLEKSLYNFNEKKMRSLEFLNEVLAVRESFDSALQELRHDQEKYERLGKKEIMGAIERLREEKLKILFAGQFKTGKSTLINALLGKKVLPADPIPCTAVITEIEYAEKPGAKLYFKENPDSLEEGLNPDVAAHLEKYGKRNVPPLEIALENESSLNDFLAIKDFGKDQAEGVKESPIAKCVVYWPLEFCKNGAVIIDSPGLNEAGARDRITMNYLRSSDIIVHVLHAIQMCGMPDREFINKVKMSGNLPILFTINRFDQLNTDQEREKIRKSALSHSLLQGEYGKDGIFFTSAIKALNARDKNNREGLLASGLSELENKMGQVFQNEKIKIKLLGVKQILADLNIFANQNLNEFRSRLEIDVEDLKREFIAKNDEFKALDKKVDQMQEKAARCLDSFSIQFESRAENFFRHFMGAALEEIVANADTSPISFLDRKDDTRKVCEELCAVVGEGIQNALLQWLSTEGTAIYQGCMREICEIIDADLKAFLQQLGHLRKDLKMRRLDMNNHNLKIDAGIFIDELGNIGIAVGGIGAGLVFVGERFLPALIGGPWGWGLMLAATAGSIIWAAVTGSKKAEVRLKDLFLVEIRKKLEDDIPTLTEMLVKEVSLKIREELSPIFDSLNKQIDDAKRPIEDAIKVLQSDQNNLREKKLRLEEFAKKFGELVQKGNKLVESF